MTSDSGSGCSHNWATDGGGDYCSRCGIRENFKAHMFVATPPVWIADWRPIAMAPKSRWLLVCDERTGEMAVWKTYLLCMQRDKEIWSTDVCGMGGYECEVDIQPTHWTELPEPKVA